METLTGYFEAIMTWVATEVPPAVNGVLYTAVFLLCVYVAWRKPAGEVDKRGLINMSIWSLIIAGNYYYIQAGALPTLWQSGFFRTSLFGLGVSVILVIIGAYLWEAIQQSLLRLFRASLAFLQRRFRFMQL